MECVCLQDAATISHKDTLKWQDGWDVFLCSFLCVFLWAMYSWNMIITSTDKHHTGTKVDNGRWRILTMGERACNNEAMVRFAEEKDETRLTQQAPMTIFTKIHKTSSLKMLFFLPHSSFNTSNHEENKELFKYYRAISTRSKEPRNDFVSSCQNAVTLQPTFQFVKMAMFVMCQHAVNTFDPWQLKCMLVWNTNLAIALS